MGRQQRPERVIGRDGLLRRVPNRLRGAVPHGSQATRSRLGLNGLNFFTAAVQAGFGPFIAVWLTQQGWTVTQLGLALSVGTFAALLGQLPGGMLVDQIHRKRYAAAGALLVMAVSAVSLCVSPLRPVVLGAEIGHALASCVMTPAIAALTLSVCGQSAFGERLGLNARYAALGNASSAALLGAASFYVSQQAVFLVTAALVLPAIVAVFVIRPPDTIDPDDEHLALKHPKEREHPAWQIFAEKPLHVFAVAVVMFQLANAALLPLALNGLARRNDAPGFLISATIIVPQVIAAILAPRAGRLTQRIGRRPILIIGFAAVPLRALLFAMLPSALPLAAFQALDGISAAVFGLMLPLIAADLTRRTGYLNLAIGALGLAGGLGATFSTVVASLIAVRFGDTLTFLILAGVGTTAVALLWVAMPETRLPEKSRTRGSDAGKATLTA
jgi:predicted MFS family arabinose efflux permease